eukprot:COSAG05_NODE_19803_length_287_cov_1.281915_1_plen_33_part_10
MRQLATIESHALGLHPRTHRAAPPNSSRMAMMV